MVSIPREQLSYFGNVVALQRGVLQSPVRDAESPSHENSDRLQHERF